MVQRIFLYFTLLLVPILFVTFNSNNACNNYLSYLNIYFSKNCYHIPDVNQDVPQIVKRHKGSCETHEVQTEDGYILTLFRIPRKNPKGVILFQHPYANDARIWVAQYNQSIAFLFWEAGYDVWLANSRGTLYSQRHVSLKPSDETFWNFSFHEMGYYDNYAAIRYIKTKTRVSKIIYLGFSMGGSLGLIYACLRPYEAAQSIEVMINMATPSFVKNSSFITLYSGPVVDFMERFGRLIGWYSYFANSAWYSTLIRNIGLLFPFKKILIYMYCIPFGWTPDEFDPNYVNLLLTQTGSSEMSHKTFYHYIQMHRSGGNFRMYDYGKEENLKMYGKGEPPLYPLSKIKIPVLLVYSENDSAVYPQDVELLYSKLPASAKVYGTILVRGFNHLDFVFGKRRTEEIYNKILKLLDNIK